MGGGRTGVYMRKLHSVADGALHVPGGDCLYGRNWGCVKKYDSLHFELCYYQVGSSEGGSD